MVSKQDATMIQISKQTRARLKKDGKMGESYDIRINRALDCEDRWKENVLKI